LTSPLSNFQPHVYQRFTKRVVITPSRLPIEGDQLLSFFGLRDSLLPGRAKRRNPAREGVTSVFRVITKGKKTQLHDWIMWVVDPVKRGDEKQKFSTEGMSGPIFVTADYPPALGSAVLGSRSHQAGWAEKSLNLTPGMHPRGGIRNLLFLFLCTLARNFHTNKKRNFSYLSKNGHGNGHAFSSGDGHFKPCLVRRPK